MSHLIYLLNMAVTTKNPNISVISSRRFNSDILNIGK